MLKHKSDLPQILLALTGPIALIVAMLFEVHSQVSSFIIWLVAWLLICRNNYILHNHIHHPFFYSKTANQLLNKIIVLSTGMPAGNWKLMHVHGHHVEHKIKHLQNRNYITRFIIPDNTSSSFHSFLKYVVLNTLPQMYVPFFVLIKMGVCSPFKRKFAISYLLDYAILFSFLFSIFLYSPKSGLIITSFYIAVTFMSLRVDYFTHVGKKPYGTIPFANNCKSPYFNKFFWNFGYHVGHHLKPNLHWSKIPAYEKELNVKLEVSKVQAHSLNFFGMLLPPFLKWNSVKLSK